MRVLLASNYGELLHTAILLKREGIEVDYYSEDKTGEGLVNKVKSINDDYDLVVSFIPEITDIALKYGIAYIGTTTKQEELFELDRKKAKFILFSAGIPYNPTFEFDNAEELEKFILKKTDKYVLKPEGEYDIPSEFTIISAFSNSFDLIHYAKAISKKHKVNRFFLEKYIEGIEFDVGGWFNGTEFLYPLEITFQYKRKKEWDASINTAEQGSVLIFTERDELHKKLLFPLIPLLREIKYKGMFSITYILSNKKFMPLEIVPRLGFPIIHNYIANTAEPIAGLFLGIAEGNRKSFRKKAKHCISYVISSLGGEEYYDIIMDSPVALGNQDLFYVELNNCYYNGLIRISKPGEAILTLTETSDNYNELLSKGKAKLFNYINIHRFIDYRIDIGERINDYNYIAKRYA